MDLNIPQSQVKLFKIKTYAIFTKFTLIIYIVETQNQNFLVTLFIDVLFIIFLKKDVEI